MIENILLGIIANFLTDFIKKLIGIVPVITPRVKIHFSPKSFPLPPQSIQARRSYNQERRDIAMAALAMFLNLFVLLSIATFIPLLFKMSSGTVHFSTTRTPLPYAIELIPITLALIFVFFFPSFYIVQKITQQLVNYVHNEWSNVSRWRAVNIFIQCCFLWLPVYLGMLCYWLFPQLTILEAFGYPICGAVVIFCFAWSSLREP